MSDSRKAIYEDTEMYEELCKKYKEPVQKDELGVDPYSEHARNLKNRYYAELKANHSPPVVENKKPNIKEMVSNGKKVKFLFYKQKELWYSTESGFEFPVPIEDTGDGAFLAEDKAILFMRYIRKHAELLENAKKEN